MIEEFHKVLQTPNNSNSHTLALTHNLLINSIEQILPPQIDLSFIDVIHREVLGEGVLPGDECPNISMDNQIVLNHRLMEHLVEVIKNQFVHICFYEALEEQTQKAERTIRSHIKIEQEMKMYLQYLEAKLQRAHADLLSKTQPTTLKRDIQILLNREQVLQKQKVSLIKANEQLQSILMGNRHQLKPQHIHPDYARAAVSNQNSGVNSGVSTHRNSPKREDGRQSKQNWVGQKQRGMWNMDLTQKKKSNYPI